MAKKIILHNSHTNPLTPGRTGTTGEQAYQIKINGLLAEEMKKYGCETVIYNGKELPNNVSGDVYLSLHLNGSVRPEPSGFTVSIYPDSTTKALDRELFDTLITKLSKMPIKNEQKYETDNSKYMYGLTRTSATTPGALVELGFATNKSDNEYLHKNINEVVEMLASALSKFLKVEKEADPQEKSSQEIEELKKKIEEQANQFKRVEELLLIKIRELSEKIEAVRNVLK